LAGEGNKTCCDVLILFFFLRWNFSLFDLSKLCCCVLND